jgi:uncharacterized protein YerC
VEALLRAGHSNLEVHRRTGAATTTVARYRRALGLPGYFMTADSPACRYGHPWPEHRDWNEQAHLICRECVRIRQRRYYVPAQPDEAAIERAVAGDPPERLTPRERHAAVARLHSWQLPASVIAERVGCSQRTVHRIRTSLAKAA